MRRTDWKPELLVTELTEALLSRWASTWWLRHNDLITGRDLFVLVWDVNPVQGECLYLYGKNYIWDRSSSIQNAWSKTGHMPYHPFGNAYQNGHIKKQRPSPFLPVPHVTTWSRIYFSKIGMLIWFDSFSSVSSFSRPFSIRMPNSVFKVPLSLGCPSTRNSQHFLPLYQELKFYLFCLEVKDFQNRSQSTFHFLITKYLNY